MILAYINWERLLSWTYNPIHGKFGKYTWQLVHKEYMGFLGNSIYRYVFSLYDGTGVRRDFGFITTEDDITRAAEFGISHKLYL